MRVRDGIGFSRRPARPHFGPGINRMWEEEEEMKTRDELIKNFGQGSKDDQYARQERQAIQSEATAPKSATSFNFGANVKTPKNYEQKERSAIATEHKSTGSTSFNYGANRKGEDDGLGSVISAAKSGAAVGEKVARGGVPGVTDEATEYAQPGSTLPMQVSQRDMLRQCESRGVNIWSNKEGEE
jgi:hypothetical protein